MAQITQAAVGISPIMATSGYHRDHHLSNPCPQLCTTYFSLYMTPQHALVARCPTLSCRLDHASRSRRYELGELRLIPTYIPIRKALRHVGMAILS